MNTVNKQIIEEASNWFVDFRVGDMDVRSCQQFQDWLRRSPDHIQAYLDIAMTYAELPAPDPTGEIDIEALINHARTSPHANVVAFKVPDTGVSEVSGPSLSPSKGPTKSVSRRALAIAASFLLTITALATWYYIERQTYTTDIGEQRSLILADGSTVELNARSRIRVRYTDHERDIELVEGQALFQVAKNKERPFIVRAGETQVRAVGTQFDVYRKTTGTVVTVVEGKVSVDLAGSVDVPSSLTTPDAPAVFLIAGEQLTVGNMAVPKPQPVNASSATAWTQRQLIFDNASLNDVAEEFNRYSTRPLLVDVPNFDTFHISGTYSSTNPEALIRFLRLQPGIKLIETDKEIRITASP